MNKTYKEQRFSSFTEIIDHCKAEYGNKSAFQIKLRENTYEYISFAAFHEHYYRLCGEFLSLGLKGRRIAVIGNNSYEWILSYLAAATVGVAVPLDKELGEEDTENFLDSAECSLVCAEGSQIRKIKKERTVLSFSEIRQTAYRNSNIDYSAVQRLVPDKNEMQILIFTSGTTGSSKGVCLSQYNICSNIYSTVSMVKIFNSDKTLSILPLHHTYECTLDHLTVLSKGGCIAYSESLIKMAKNIAEYSPTVLVVVPELLKALARRIRSSIVKECPQKYQALYKELPLSEAFAKTPFIIRTVIRKKIKKALGGKIRMFIVGAADLDT